MKTEYEVIIDNAKFKLERVITEFGVCDTFNSKWAPYFHPNYYLVGDVPNEVQLFEISNYDLNIYALINDLMSSTVNSQQVH